MRADHLVALVEEILITLDQALEHVEDELLVVVDEHSEDAGHGQEDAVPLKIAHLDLGHLIRWYFDFKQGKQGGQVLLGGDLENECQRVDDFVSELVTLLRITLALRLLAILSLGW